MIVRLEVQGKMVELYKGHWNCCVCDRKPIGEFSYKELKENYPRGKFRKVGKNKLILVNAESKKFQIIDET